MTFGSFDPQRQHSMMSDINVTPLVDVMLVLLVIFILAAPMFTHAVKLELPRAEAAAEQRQADAVSISIDAGGQVFWNEEPVDAATLDAKLVQTARLALPPELQLRADKDTRYEIVAQVMAAAQTKGLTRLGFVTDPNKESTHGKR